MDKRTIKVDKITFMYCKKVPWNNEKISESEN